ncbi:MAG: hypothetical protein JW924_03205 [Fusobacteriaceae bacterium]|nr:hypothetical protein [Fusobacteriaceae bacterium]
MDNTLCSSIQRNWNIDQIPHCEPYKFIKVINELYENHTIIIYTHRSEKCKVETIKWLKKYKVKYHKIKFNKPRWDLLIDDKTLPPYHFLNAKMLEDYAEKVKKWNFDKGSFHLQKKYQRKK